MSSLQLPISNLHVSSSIDSKEESDRTPRPRVSQHYVDLEQLPPHHGDQTSFADPTDSAYYATGFFNGRVHLYYQDEDLPDEGYLVRKWVAHQQFVHAGVVWSGAVLNLAFSPDRQRLASAGGDCVIRIWSVHEGESALPPPLKPNTPLTGHTGAVRALAWSTDGMQLASGSDDLTVRLWDAERGVQLHSVKDHKAPVTGVRFYGRDGSGRQQLYSEDSTRWVIWDITEKGTLVHSYDGRIPPPSHDVRLQGALPQQPAGTTSAGQGSEPDNKFTASSDGLGLFDEVGEDDSGMLPSLPDIFSR